jgi:DNA-binding IclR family transcriptional regulator
MRPFMLDPNLRATVLCDAAPPEEIRGSISRRLIADKTGCPRETVRRKVVELAEKGHITIDSEDRIRIAQGLYDPRACAAVEQGHQAILRYLERLRQLGVDPSATFRGGAPS